MNRNVESRFAMAPSTLDIRRSIFDRSCTTLLSGNVGDCIPFFLDEVLPGDTFNISTATVIRLQTLVHPIMDNMYMDMYYFFVPNRLIWDNWKKFCGEDGPDWYPKEDYVTPKLTFGEHPGVGSLADYMGIPLTVHEYSSGGVTYNVNVNALPFRAYAKCMTDWFRDENLTDPCVIYTGDADQNVNAKDASDIYCALGGPVFKASKYHDYFTSCLPSPQVGPAISIPTNGELAIVNTGNLSHDVNNYALGFTNINSPSSKTFLNGTNVVNTDSATRTVFASNATGIFAPNNLYADVGATLGTINDLRIAFQVQKFYEKMNYGRRYTEILKSQFGVTSPDARLQRSEYLGGKRVPLNVREVTQNSPSENSFLGDLGAYSRTSDVHGDFVHSFTEHGYILGIMVVRYDHTYGQGLDRLWSRNTIFDYYWPVFANIGNQAVKKRELYFDTSDATGFANGSAVFGYQEAWADYRYKQNRTAGLMRPEASGTLASWHLADDYNEYPSLSDAWIREAKANVDRVLAVTSEVSDQFFADIAVKNTCTRVMPLYSIPGLADHH